MLCFFSALSFHPPSLPPSLPLPPSAKLPVLGTLCCGTGLFRPVASYSFSSGNFITEGHRVAASCVPFCLSSSEAGSQYTHLLGVCQGPAGLACLGPRDVSQNQSALKFVSTQSRCLCLGLFRRLSSVWVQTAPVPHVKKCSIPCNKSEV